MTTPSGTAPVTIASYYRVHWGHAEEFIELFRRNHWPILREQLESGGSPMCARTVHASTVMVPPTGTTSSRSPIATGPPSSHTPTTR